MEGHGYVYWNELLTSDVESSKAFYGKCLGWTYSEMPMSEGTYWVITPDGADRAAGGMMQTPADSDWPTNVWFTYVAVADLDAALAGVETGGGAILRPPFEVPEIGRIAIVRDATGAVMGWMTPLRPG